MTDDIEERAVLARRGIMDHSDCEDCVEDWTFLMRQGRREFPLGLRTVLACLAFAEREGAVPELPADWWVNMFLVKSVFRVSSLIFFGFRHEECRPVVCFTGCPSCRT